MATHDGHTLFLEYTDVDDAWFPVCEEHVDDDAVHVELTAEVAQTPVGALTQILVDDD